MHIHRFNCFLWDQIIIIGSETLDDIRAIDMIYIDYCDALLIVWMNLAEFVLFS